MGYKFLIILSLCIVVLFTAKQTHRAKNVAEKPMKIVSKTEQKVKKVALKDTFNIEVFGDTLRLDTAGNALVPVGRWQDSGAYFNLKIINIKYGGKDSLLFENGQYYLVKVLPLSPSIHGGLASSYVLYVLKEGKSAPERLYLSQRNLKDFKALGPALPLKNWGFAGKNRLVFSVSNDTSNMVYQYNFAGNGIAQLMDATEAAETSVVNALKINSK